MAFGLSTILARQIRKDWASGALYTLAAISAWSRLYKDEHWLTDVLIGGALGYYSATAIWRWYGQRSAVGERLTVVPVGSGFVARLGF